MVVDTSCSPWSDPLSPTIFIQANERQMLGAKIAAYSHQRRRGSQGTFDVRILDVRHFPELTAQGRSYLRDGREVRWNPDDLQSFTPLRFAPPQLMNFRGRALVTDPDCFAVGDTAKLFNSDMEGKAIRAAWQPWRRCGPPHWASSVMLLDCAKLRHWDFHQMVAGLFRHDFDYQHWNRLELEDQSIIGPLDPIWNNYDELTSRTQILHTTNRRTQPWKSGLPVEYTFYRRSSFGFLHRIRRPRYRHHPDPRVEAFVYSLLAEMLDQGLVSEAEVQREMARNHVRHDSLELVAIYRGWEPFKAAA